MNYKKNFFLFSLFLLFNITAKCTVIDDIRDEARAVFLIGTDDPELDVAYYQAILSDLNVEGEFINGSVNYPNHNFEVEHLQKLVELTQARARKQNNPTTDLTGLNMVNLETEIVAGLNWWYQNVDYNESNESWWWNEIGKQRELHKISVLFYDYLNTNDPILTIPGTTTASPIEAPEELFIGADCQDPPGDLSTAEICTIKEAISADFPVSIQEPDDDEDYTGANKADIAGSIIAKGLLEDKIAYIDAGKDEIRCSMVFSTLDMPDHDYDGIREDYSFQQHNTSSGEGLLYAGGYGQSLIHNVATWGIAFQEADYDFDPAHKQIFFDFILKGYRRMIIGNTTDYSANGRYIVRSYPNNNAAIPPEDMDLVIKMAGGGNTDTGGKLEEMKAASVPGSRQVFEESHYHFWKSDYVTHHEDNYFTSVRVCSERTIGTESLGGQNQRGYWLPYGCTYFYQRGDEYIRLNSGGDPTDSDDYTRIFPFMDFKYIPGVTCPAFRPDFDRPNGGTLRSTQSDDFVGNTSNGNYGVTTMRLDKDYDNDLSESSTNEVNLSAKKAWL